MPAQTRRPASIELDTRLPNLSMLDGRGHPQFSPTLGVRVVLTKLVTATDPSAAAGFRFDQSWLSPP